MHTIKSLLAPCVLVLLAGCASDGLLSEAAAPAETFEVAANYQAAYRRAAEYVRVCHEERQHAYGLVYQSKRQQGVKGAPNEVVVFKESEPRKILQRITAQADGPATSRVTVTVLGDGAWGAEEIAAAKASIQSSTPVCRPLDKR